MEFTLQYGDVYFHPVSPKHKILIRFHVLLMETGHSLLTISVSCVVVFFCFLTGVEHLSLCQAGCRRLAATS